MLEDWGAVWVKLLRSKRGGRFVSWHKIGLYQLRNVKRRRRFILNTGCLG